MQGRERSEGMSKSETGLQSLSQGSRIRVWNGEGQAGLSIWSSENGTKVCGWILEQVWVMGMCGSEFWCGVTRSVTLIWIEKRWTIFFPTINLLSSFTSLSSL